MSLKILIQHNHIKLVFSNHRLFLEVEWNSISIASFVHCKNRSITLCMISATIYFVQQYTQLVIWFRHPTHKLRLCKVSQCRYNYIAPVCYFMIPFLDVSQHQIHILSYSVFSIALISKRLLKNPLWNSSDLIRDPVILSSWTSSYPTVWSRIIATKGLCLNFFFTCHFCCFHPFWSANVFFLSGLSCIQRKQKYFVTREINTEFYGPYLRH